MATAQNIRLGVSVTADVEYREGRPKPYKARVRWNDPTTGERRSKSHSTATPEEAQTWNDDMIRAASGGLNLAAATRRLADYGNDVMPLATRGLERKTLDPYLAGWRLRVVPTLGHIPTRMITNGVVHRAVYGWIADECSRSTVKNTLAILVRVLEQAVRDGVVDHNVARVTGWQREYQQAEDELDDPRSLALPDWETLVNLADALVARSHGHFTGWGHIITFAACTAARIGVVSGPGTSTGRRGREPSAGRPHPGRVA
jgi:hypothetical protein